MAFWKSKISIQYFEYYKSSTYMCNLATNVIVVAFNLENLFKFNFIPSNMPADKSLYAIFIAIVQCTQQTTKIHQCQQLRLSMWYVHLCVHVACTHACVCVCAMYNFAMEFLILKAVTLIIPSKNILKNLSEILCEESNLKTKTYTYFKKSIETIDRGNIDRNKVTVSMMACVVDKFVLASLHCSKNSRHLARGITIYYSML